MYNFNYQDPNEEQRQVLGQLSEDYAPSTDFGRVSMGQAPEAAPQEQEQAPIDQQVETAQTMNQANVAAAEGIGETVQAEQVADPTAFQYTSQGATDTEALGEGMFAFGLKLLAASSRPGADLGGSMAEALAAGAPAFSSALNRQKRFENIKALEAKGFTQESIDAYIKSGDNKDLVKGKPGPNYIKTKELNGTMYQYDERDPANTMKPVMAGPKQIKGSVDLGDKVLIHYTDGTQEYQSKGLSPASAAKAAGGGSGGGKGKGAGAPDPDDIRVITSPDGKRLAHAYAVKDKETGVVQWLDAGTSVPIDVPQGSTFQKDPDYTSAVKNQRADFTTYQRVGTGLSRNVASVKTLLESGANPYDLRRFAPRTPAAEDSDKYETARSQLLVGIFKDTPGMGGMTAATEQTMQNTMPKTTASTDVKVKWAKDYLDEMINGAQNYIEESQEFGNKVPSSITSSLKQMQELRATLDQYGQGPAPTPKSERKVVKAPSAPMASASNAYGGAAQAQQPKPAKDFSSLW